jgi:hypothetical protein
MTAERRTPFLIERAVSIPIRAADDAPFVYDDERMMNLVAANRAPAHSALSASEEGGTKKTAVDRETTDDS